MQRPLTSTMTRTRARGFTLAELLVAIIAGLMVAAAAISFSKQSTRFFSQEARIASAQMSVLAGFQRMQSDISRAANMSTSNMKRDLDIVKVCAPNYANWPASLRNLTGFAVPIPHSTTPNPRSFRVSGSITSIEAFPVRTIINNGVGHDVYLQVNTGAMTRSGFTEGANLKSIFVPGKVLRIRDQKGDHEFEVIVDAEFKAGGQPWVRTKGPLPLMGDVTAASARCGIEGFAIGLQANVVDIVDYAIANVKDHPVYKRTVYSDAGYSLGDEGRTELIRRDVLLGAGDPAQDIEKDDNAEIVAEYAVDMRVGLWASNPGGVGGLTYIDDPSSKAFKERMTVAASYPLDATRRPPPPTGPESVRSVELRLAIRSRETDRAENTNVTDPVLDGGFMFRYPMPNGRFARVRTLVADIALHNQSQEGW